MNDLRMSTIKEWPILKPIKMPIECKCIKMVYVFGENGEEVLCVTTEDVVYGFGNNCNGVLGLGHNNAVNEPTIVEELCGKQIDSIVCNNYYSGYGFVLALTRSGHTYAWGSNQNGCVGDGTIDNCFKPKMIEALEKIKVVDICCGRRHCLALTQTGEVYAWGGNGYGECGNGNTSPQLTPIKVLSNDTNKFISVVCGAYHSLAMSDSGVIYGWGCNDCGALGIGNTVRQSRPVQLKIDFDVTKIRAAFYHTFFLSSNGEVYVFGGYDTDCRNLLPEKLSFASQISDIEAVPQGCLLTAVSVFKPCFVWGLNQDFTPTEVTLKSLNEILNSKTGIDITIRPVKLYFY